MINSGLLISAGAFIAVIASVIYFGARLARIKRVVEIDESQASERFAEGDATESLSERQKEALRLISQQRQRAEIARRLGISNQTAKAHVDAARKALDVSSPVEATREPDQDLTPRPPENLSEP